MPNLIQEAVEKELNKQPEPQKEPEPSKQPEKTPEVDKKEPEPKVEPKTTEAKPDDKKDDYKEIELDPKLKVVPYERFKDINDKYKALKTEKEEAAKKKTPPKFEDEEDKEMHDKFKKLWFQTTDELDDAKLQLKEEALRDEEQRILDKEVRTLEREFDGTDWLPQFKKEEVLNRGIENQVFDPRAAYVVMNLSAIINHFVKKSLSGVSKPISGKNNERSQPDITPTWDDKQKLKGTALTNFLTEKIKWMMGANG